MNFDKYIESLGIKKLAEYAHLKTIILMIILIVILIIQKLTELNIDKITKDLVVQQSIFFLSMLNPVFWISLLAPLSYITAVYNASVAFKLIAKGNDFNQAVIAQIRKMGANLGFGAFASVFIAPTLIAWVNLRGGIKLDLTIESIIIGVVGGTLYFITILSAKLRQELDEIV